jgi:hypothetical protein
MASDRLSAAVGVLAMRICLIIGCFLISCQSACIQDCENGQRTCMDKAPELKAACIRAYESCVQTCSK